MDSPWGRKESDTTEQLSLHYLQPKESTSPDVSPAGTLSLDLQPPGQGEIKSFYLSLPIYGTGLRWWLSGKQCTCQCRRCQR